MRSERQVFGVRQLPWLLAGLLASTGACGSDGNDDSEVESDDMGAGAEQDAGQQGGDEVSRVTVQAGELEGVVEGTTREFFAIPYAKPPVGELRFMPPQPAEPWEGVREAKEFGNACSQASSVLGPPTALDEDCLTLNVYAPASAAAQAKPVMIWIHGGAFVTGGSSMYDGRTLSENGDVVVVTINYRLGPLGFVSLEALDAARSSVASGNDGLRDQQLALRWVKDNIAAFGGDPNNMTVFGESAGSMSACVHMVSPTAGGLVDRFIMESGACLGGVAATSKADADALGAALVADLCPEADDVLACLRAASTDDLVAWGADRGPLGAGWGPVVNPADDLFPEPALDAIASGNFNQAPVIMGTNQNEWLLFQRVGISPAISTIAEFDAAVEDQLGADAEAVKAHYGLTDDAQANDVLIRVVTDSAFRCPVRTVMRALTEAGVPGYLYSFELGDAMHAGEIPYVFGNPQSFLAPVFNQAMADAVQGYWSRFATTGDPNGAGAVAWPAYGAGDDPHLVLDETIQAGAGLGQADCDFWASASADAEP